MLRIKNPVPEQDPYIETRRARSPTTGLKVRASVASGGCLSLDRGSFWEKRGDGIAMADADRWFFGIDGDYYRAAVGKAPFVTKKVMAITSICQKADQVRLLRQSGRR